MQEERSARYRWAAFPNSERRIRLTVVPVMLGRVLA